MAYRDSYEKWLKETGGKAQFQTSYAKWQMEENGSSIANSITSRVNTWLKNSNTFYNNYENRYGGDNTKYRSDSSQWLDKTSLQKSNFDQEAENIRTELNKYRNYLGEDYVKQIEDALDSGSQMHSAVVSGATTDKNFWTQFETEAAYNNWYAGEKKKEEQANFDTTKGAEEVEKIRADYELAKQIQQKMSGNPNEFNEGDPTSVYSSNYNELKKQFDSVVSKYGGFEGLSKTLTDKQAYLDEAIYIQGGSKEYDKYSKNADWVAMSGYTESSSWNDAHDYVNIGHELKNDQEYGFVPEASAENIRKQFSTEWEEYGYMMTDKEVSVYNYLYNTSGKDAAQKYLGSLSGAIEQRKFEETDDRVQGLVEKAPFTANVGATLLTPIAAVESTLNIVSNAMTGDTNKNKFSYVQSTIREETSKDYSELGKLLYNTATSGADSILAMFIPYGLGGAMLGANAMGSAWNDAIDRGVTPENSILTAVSAGLAEMLFESLSIGNLKGIKKWLESGSSTAGKFFLKLLASSGINAGEEVLTEISNIATDIIINADLSNAAALFEAYKLQDKTDEEARKYVAGQLAKQVGEAGISGFLMGAGTTSLFGASQGIQNAVYDRRTGKAFKAQGADAVQNIVDLGKSFSADSVAYKLAGKVNENSKASQIGKLFRAESAYLSEQNKADVRSSLEARGVEAKDAADMADMMARYISGDRYVSAEEASVLENNKMLGEVMDYVLVEPNITVNQQISARQRMMQEAKNDLFDEALVQGAIAQTAKETKQKKSEVEGIVRKEFEEARSKNIEDGKMKVDTTEDGETRANGAVVKLEGVSGKTNDGYTVRVVDENGNESEVPASAIEYGSETDAVLYESFFNLGADPSDFSAYKNNFDPEDFDARREDPATAYALGYAEAYNYGKISGKINTSDSAVFSGSLNPVARTAAANSGIRAGEAEANRRQESIDKAKEKAKPEKKPKNSGKAVIDAPSYNSQNKRHQATVGMANRIAEMGFKVYVYESHAGKDGKRYLKNGKPAPNGFFRAKDGSIHIDLYAGSAGESIGVYTLSHELVHAMKLYSPKMFREFSDMLVEFYNEKGVSVPKLVRAKMKEFGYSWDVAYEEVIADSCSTFLTDGDIFQRVESLKQSGKFDKGFFEKMQGVIKKFVDFVKGLYKDVDPETDEGMMMKSWSDELDSIYQKFSETLLDASETIQWVGNSIGLGTGIDTIEDYTRYSYASLAQAAGFMAVEEDGQRMYVRDGSRVTNVTVDDIDNSPIGALINYSLEVGDISKEDAFAQKKMFADICNICANVGDFAMGQQFIGSSIFTGLKSNADKQYGTTYDFPSICTKTQAVIDAMSAKMMKEGRGLTAEEIASLYQEVFHAGNPVPCPECYVFSRWIGVGGLLNNISTYQNEFKNMTPAEVRQRYLDMERQIQDELAAENEKRKAEGKDSLTFGKAKGSLAKKYTKQYADLDEEISKKRNQGEEVSDSELDKLKFLDSQMNTIKAMSWINGVYFKSDSDMKKGIRNERYFVPNDILFDLNNGESFATEYPEAWGFRTTQGAGYGKAITPYAEAVLGEGIIGTNAVGKFAKDKAAGKYTNKELAEKYGHHVSRNKFLDQKGKLNKDARETLEKARLKMKIQSFLGGQRLQSTSDARYENATDYLLAFLEIQSMGGTVQLYTKVDGAVQLFSVFGSSSNQSLMPLGGGLDKNGNPVDTKVGGIDPNVAKRNRDKYENAGTITIGVNDNHIRAMLGQKFRDFIIPYHASGGKASLVSEFRRIQEGKAEKSGFVRSSDYTKVQGEKKLSDSVLRNLGKTEAEIEKIHKVREARLSILTGGKPNMEVVRANEFLSALYDKFNGGEWDGVKIQKGKVEAQIYPNEFWDKSVSYDESGKITKDYLEYCDQLGFLHRFSGMVTTKSGTLKSVSGYDENGNKVPMTDLAYKYKDGVKTNEVEDFFWKLLVDRRMYGNDGQYLEQQVINLGNGTVRDVTTFAKNNSGRQYSELISMQTVQGIKDGTLYSLRRVPDVKPTSENWSRTKTTDEVKQEFPKLWDVSAEESSERNPTQVTSTIKSYRHIYDILKAEGFSGKILDASSGLGLGTTAGREEYGFSVDDVEPYPSESYNPKYTDYSKISGKYDVIISNAVLNVLPQDQRDALVVRMGELLNDGGRIFINVRGNDVRNAKSKVAINEDLMEYYISDSGSYQKGFTANELKAYLEDALGEDFYVQKTSDFGKVSVIVTKDEGDVRFQQRSGNSTRSILANALESTAQNETEKKVLEEYKSKISLLEKNQEKLGKLRSQIKELSFAPGKRDTGRLNKLKLEAKKTENRINLIDKSILKLESMESIKAVVEREKKKAKKKQKEKDTEATKAYKERAMRAQMRGKVKRVVSELSNLLLKGTKEKNINIGFQKQVAESLLAVNMDTVDADSRLKKKAAQIEKAKKNNNEKLVEKLEREYANIEAQGERMDKKLSALHSAYASIAESKDPLLSSIYSQELSDVILSVKDKVGDTPIRNMTLDQLSQVYKAYKTVISTVRDYNKLQAGNVKESAIENGQSIMKETAKYDKEKKTRAVATRWVNQYYWNSLKPIYAARKIGSETFSKLFNNVMNGQYVAGEDFEEAHNFFQSTVKKYGYWDWDTEKTRNTFKSKEGKEFTLNTEEIMSLYAYQLREKGLEHIYNGGFTLRSEFTEKKLGVIPVKMETQTAESYNLDEESLHAITDTLTESQKGFVEEMVRFLSEVMGAKGNEVSLKLYGIRLFEDDMYFPIETDPNFARKQTKEQREANAGRKRKNAGFTKMLNDNADNPVVLRGFREVWANHTQDMSLYHGLVIPMEDMEKVFNYKEMSNGESTPNGVQASIQNAFGKEAVSYFERFFKDLNGNSIIDPVEGMFSKGLSLFKKGAVFASASVAIQQYSAVARAMAYIDPKYFASLPPVKNRTAVWEEIKKYAPVAIIKEASGFDTGVGHGIAAWITEREYDKSGEKEKAFFTDSQYRDSVLGSLPSAIDEIGWGHIWKATLKEVADNTGLKGEELKKAAGDRFTEVINLTQVYDSVFSRSAFMRSNTIYAKMATAFMAEPTVNLNMLADAYTMAKRGDKEGAARAISGVMVSSVLNAILVSLVYAARDDDEDETYTEKYLQSLSAELVESMNPLEMMVFVKDIVSIFKGYDSSRTDLESFSQLYNAYKQLWSSTKSSHDKVVDFAGTLCNMFGVPLRNIMRDVDGIYNIVNGAINGEKTTGAGIWYSVKEEIPFIGSSTPNSDQLYYAMTRGDEAHLERVAGRYEDESSLESAIRKGLRENDSRIQEAAEAKFNGDLTTYSSIVNEIIGEGIFDDSTIVAAVNSEVSNLEKEAEKEEGGGAEEEAVEKEDVKTSIYSTKDIHTAFDGGDVELAISIIDEIVSTKVENDDDEGETEEQKQKQAKSSVRSSVTAYWKEKYEVAYFANDEEEMKRIREILFQTGLYGRKSELLDTIKGWVKGFKQ